MSVACASSLAQAATVTAGMIEPAAEERALLSAVLAGDRTAAESLVDRTYVKIFGLLCHLTGGNRDLAADLTQESYRRAWQALSSFDGRARLSTWLYRIATNVFLNHVRRPRSVVPLEDEHIATVPAVGRRQDDEASDRQLGERLRKAVLRLPEEQRFAVVAFYWGETPVREIAHVEEVSEVAIRKRLRRAMDVLRRALEEVGE
jgi:RNA polymerase sigma-70 factor, ECF subfamily